MSSRNLYLSPEELQSAAVIHRALAKAKEVFKEGERSGNRITELVRSTIQAEPLARVDYVNISDAETLEKLDRLDERPAMVAVAVYFGKTRLIDNTILNSAKKKDQVSQTSA
jgi:pantoate--beta-alanine ligase